MTEGNQIEADSKDTSNQRQPEEDAKQSQDGSCINQMMGRAHDTPGGDVNAATKGAGKGKKGGKGYGECWHCGEWGHPRRECPHLNDLGKGMGSRGGT